MGETRMLEKERLGAFMDAVVASLLLANALVIFVFVVLGLAVMPKMTSVGIIVSSLVYILPLGGRDTRAGR